MVKSVKIEGKLACKIVYALNTFYRHKRERFFMTEAITFFENGSFTIDLKPQPENEEE